MDKLRFQFYRERKVKSLAGFTVENTVNINKLINSKVKYDPFDMRTKGTSKHNLQNLFKSKYKQFIRGSINRVDFVYWLSMKDYLAKYAKRFM